MSTSPLPQLIAISKPGHDTRILLICHILVSAPGNEITVSKIVLEHKYSFARSLGIWLAASQGTEREAHSRGQRAGVGIERKRRQMWLCDLRPKASPFPTGLVRVCAEYFLLHTACLIALRLHPFSHPGLNYMPLRACSHCGGDPSNSGPTSKERGVDGTENVRKGQYKHVGSPPERQRLCPLIS